MASIRAIQRGGRTYYYAAQSYRWEGHARQLTKYLGTAKPLETGELLDNLEREVWAKTWFRLFDQHALAYRRRRARLPKSVDSAERRAFANEFTFDTNRIEGSTLTRDESRELLERGITPRSKPWKDASETIRHAALAERLLARPSTPTVSELLAWHAQVFGDTRLDIAGRLRDYDVRIGQSRHRPPHWAMVRALMTELDGWLEGGAVKLHPVERAGAFHLRFESVHPFGDGNGRVGRLALNSLLVRDGYPPVNIVYAKRRGYYHALERSNVVDSPGPFLHWFFAYYARNHEK